MQNTNYSQSSEKKLQLIKNVSIFDHVIGIKNYCCSTDGRDYKEKDVTQVHMRILPTSFCPCSCRFCIAEAGRRDKSRIDTKKLERVLKRLREEDIVRGVTITGGEPFCEPELTEEIVNMLFDIWDRHFEVTIDTCGINLDKMLGMKNLSILDQVHISRHHYLDEVNEKIFGAKVPTMKELSDVFHEIAYPDLFVLNCMLMKDYIGTTGEVCKYLDHAIEMGAKKVSFISGSPSNDFISEQALDYRSVINTSNPSFLFTRGYFDFDVCRCQDGVYASEQGDIIEFYGRCTLLNKERHVRSLIYAADNYLRSGFGGEILI